MPRDTRSHIPGSFHHVVLRGNRRQDIFFDDASRERFLRLLFVSSRRHGCTVHSFCELTNHAHLLIQVGATPLGKMMHELEFRYAQYINWRFGLDGHLFQGRYLDILCKDDAQLLTVLRYIHRNPVKHGLVADLGQWPWSSHRAYLGELSPLVETRFCLSLFGKSRDAVEAYRAFVGADAPARWPHKKRNTAEAPPPAVTLRRENCVETLAAILERRATEAGASRKEVAGSSKRRGLSSLRQRIALEAFTLGYPISEIALALGRSRSTIHEAIQTAKAIQIRTESEQGD